MMNPILEKFEDALSRIKLSKPAVPFVSTLTGNWAGEEVTEPGYWSRQLRQTVRFADGMRTLIKCRRSGLEKSDLYRSRPRKHAFDVHKGDSQRESLCCACNRCRARTRGAAI